MSCRSDEGDYAAPPLPFISTPTKAIRNDGTAHAESDAERMETKSEADVEKQFDESTGNLAWKMFSTFGWNGSIKALLLSTTIFAYVLF